MLSHHQIRHIPVHPFGVPIVVLVDLPPIRVVSNPHFCAKHEKALSGLARSSGDLHAQHLLLSMHNRSEEGPNDFPRGASDVGPRPLCGSPQLYGQTSLITGSGVRVPAGGPLFLYCTRSFFFSVLFCRSSLHHLVPPPFFLVLLVSLSFLLFSLFVCNFFFTYVHGSM